MDQTFRKIMIVFCLVASLFAFTAVSVEGKVSSETVAESIFDFEVAEEIAHFREERSRRKHSSVFSHARKLDTVLSQFKLRRLTVRLVTERDGLNGMGGFLRI